MRKHLDNTGCGVEIDIFRNKMCTFNFSGGGELYLYAKIQCYMPFKNIIYER